MNRKKSIIFVILLFAGSSFLFSNSVRQESAKQLFERALYLEETKGDLEKAIGLYKRILDEFAENHEIAAQAQLHIGFCFEKLGLKEAQKAYQNVVNNYPEQTESVKVAKEKLSLLLKAQSVFEKAGTEPDVRQIDSDIPGWYGTVSPDGRYFSYVDWSDGNLAVYEFKTKKSRILTDEGAWEELPRQYADISIWSPDSKQIAYGWFIGEEINKKGELRVIGLDGSKLRIIHSGGSYPLPCDWSRDGRFILSIMDNLADPLIPGKIVLVSVTDGSIRTLKSLGDGLRSSWASLSPDGRYVAYSLSQEKDSEKKDIYLISTDGSYEVPLVEHLADDRVPYWTPDSRGIVFISDRSGTDKFWKLEVVDGKPKRAPERVIMIEPSLTICLSPSGSLYFFYGFMGSNVSIMTIDVESGEVLKPPAIVSQRFEGTNRNPCWSPDGKYLAYFSRRGKDSWILVFRNVETGEERDCPLQPKFRVGKEGPPRLDWSPDGRTLTAVGNVENRQGLYRIDIRTGDVFPIITSGPEVQIRQHAWSPEGKVIFYLREDQGDLSTSIVARDMETEKEKVLYRVDVLSLLSNFAISPDGRKLVFRTGERSKRFTLDVLKIIPTEGGEPQDLMVEQVTKYSNIDPRAGMEWTPDGKYIIFGRFSSFPNTNRLKLYRVSSAGGKSEALGDMMVEHNGFLRIHPDGQRIAYNSYRGTDIGGIWVLENFLPKLTDKK